uniref:Uncharacterized protein n=1 Tax=Anguilla anguilla TaxID=7936 RepID=A0A0E9QPC0_ANGAN
MQSQSKGYVHFTIAFKLSHFQKVGPRAMKAGSTMWTHQ